MIYLIDFETCYKIGRTLDLKKRLKLFKNTREDIKCIDLIVKYDNPIDLNNNDIILETELHKRCKKFNIKNELFLKCDEVIQIFKKYKEEQKDFNDYSQLLLELSNNSIKNIENSNDKKPKRILEKITYLYNLNGELLNIYSSRKEAERENNIYSGKIKEVINGRQLTAGGYIWSDNKLSELEINEKIERINNSKSSKLSSTTKLNLYSLDGNFIKTWKTMTEAANELGITVSSISLCCKGKYKKAGGFIWKIE